MIDSLIAIGFASPLANRSRKLMGVDAIAGVRYPPQLLPEVVATLSSAQAVMATAVPGAVGSAVSGPQVHLLVAPVAALKHRTAVQPSQRALCTVWQSLSKDIVITW